MQDTPLAPTIIAALMASIGFIGCSKSPPPSTGKKPPTAAPGDAAPTEAAPSTPKTPKTPCKIGDRQDCQKRCDAGEAGACANLGAAYRGGIGGQPDEASAAKAFDKACELNHKPTCGALGISLAGSDEYWRTTANLTSARLLLGGEQRVDARPCAFRLFAPVSGGDAAPPAHLGVASHLHGPVVGRAAIPVGEIGTRRLNPPA